MDDIDSVLVDIEQPADADRPAWDLADDGYDQGLPMQQELEQ